jgi:hypothetical protein
MCYLIPYRELLVPLTLPFSVERGIVMKRAASASYACSQLVAFNVLMNPAP